MLWNAGLCAEWRAATGGREGGMNWIEQLIDREAKLGDGSSAWRNRVWREVAGPENQTGGLSDHLMERLPLDLDGDDDEGDATMALAADWGDG